MPPRNLCIISAAQRAAPWSAAFLLWLALDKSVAAGELRMLQGHSGPVQSVAFSPDGELLASCSPGPPARVMLWSTTTGELVSSLSTNAGHRSFQRVEQLAFVPEGKTLIGCATSYGTCNCDRKVLAWDTASPNARIAGSFPERPFYKFAISRDGKTLASATPPDWNEARWARLSELASKSGSFASRSSDHNLILWDQAAGQVRASADFPDVFALAFSPDAKTLAASLRNRVVLLDASSLYPIDAIDAAGQVALMTFSHDGTMLATVPNSADDPKSPGKCVSLWSVSTGGLTRTFQAQAGPIRALAFSPRGRVLATAGGVPEVSEIRLWDVESGELLTEFKGHDGPACCVAFSPDGKTLAWGGDGWTVRLWDLAMGCLN